MRLLLMVMMAFSVQAADLPFGSGGQTGNYYAMLNELLSKEWCGDISKDQTPMVKVSQGSVHNLEGMLNKAFFGGIVQSDVLYFMAKNQSSLNQNNIGIVGGLHLEAFHLLIPNNWKPKKPKSSSWFGFSFSPKQDKAVEVNLELLKDQVVGSWGGSMLSLRALSDAFDLNLNIIEIRENERNDPRIPVFLVGGPGYTPVTQILETGRYQLVGINQKELKDEATKLGLDASLYLDAPLTYIIKGKTLSVPSVGVQALLVTKKYRRQSKNAYSEALAKCLDDSLLDLADDFNTNKNWQSAAELTEKGELLSWPYYEIKD